MNLSSLRLVFPIALAFSLIASVASAYSTLTASPSFVNFINGPVGGTQFQTVYIQNSGTEDAKNVHVNSSCDGSFLINDSCFMDLKPYQSCSVTIQYHPFTAGFHTCNIYVSGTNTSSAYISVQGQASEPE